MARHKQIPKPPRKCIFCGGIPISKEHVWAEWMRPYLPSGEGSQSVKASNVLSGQVVSRKGPLDRKGDARSQKLKVACESCNNGWMSQLQSQTKPVLLPLLLRDHKTLGPAEQQTLATWLAMFVMVYEWSAPEYATATNYQRQQFKTSPMPPNEWAFWVAPFDALSTPALLTGFGAEDVLALAGQNAPKINKAALTLCGAGAVSFAIFSANSDYSLQTFPQTIATIVEEAGYTRLWPTTGDKVRVLDRRLIPLSHADLLSIRDVLAEGMRQAWDRGPRHGLAHKDRFRS
jgi:hypothetical protein